MVRKTGLGRGLDALIPGSEEAPQERGFIEVRLDKITPNPRQPRTQVNSEGLAELAASIREHGILQPLIVRLDGGNSQYILIAGERRWRAAKQAGLETVPVIIRQASDQEQLELALIENVQRADLTPLEMAEAYRQLTEEFGLSQEEVALRVGKSRTAVTNTLRLQKLPKAIQTALAAGEISEGHARALLGLNTPQAQVAAFQAVINKGLNVRQTEEIVRKLNGQRKPYTPSQKAKLPEIHALEERLRTHLGTKVNLHHSPNGGTLVIHYYSDEELDTLIQQILNG